MTELLDKAYEKIRALPSDMQDEAARLLMSYAGDDAPMVALTGEEKADLIEAQQEVTRGEVATAAEVQAVFAKYRR